MQRAWITLVVAGLLAAVCSSALAQRYVPPGGNGNNSNNSNNGNNGSNSEPNQANPDPFSLTLAVSGAAAAAGYVVRRKRAES